MKLINHTNTSKSLSNKSLSFFIFGISLSLVGCLHTSNDQQIAQEQEARNRAKVQNVSQARVAMEMLSLSGSRMMLVDQPQPNRDNYQHLAENNVKRVTDDPVSTFSIDVDTGSYTNSRRMLVQGYLPPADAVRAEEFINYFDYQYPVPTEQSVPFAIDTAISTAPWNTQRHLLRIGLKGSEFSVDRSQGSNLVFLIDVSGSMSNPNKLPLLKRSMKLLSQQLTERDKVSIVVYAGASGVVLEPTKGNDHFAISAALEKLSAGGATNGAAGIELAYQMAQKAFIKDGVNRVVLATDGDFNLGVTNQDRLVELVTKHRENGIALTTLGFGRGNYNDYLMEQLADVGNGNYAYIDNINEARKVLVDELTSTMHMIAKDVKIQVEFNPAVVSEYRLLGYENRILEREDFNNDKVDAGDIGAGHSVTAFYEVTLHNSKQPFNDPLRYQTKTFGSANLSQEIANVKLRYKRPDQDNSALLSKTVSIDEILTFESQSDDFRFATAVASFAQILKNSKYTGDLSFAQVLSIATSAKGIDHFGYRSEFIQLVRTADALSAKVSYNEVPENDKKHLVKLGRYENPVVPRIHAH
jgi:Ca-activated chloride channel family protein